MEEIQHTVKEVQNWWQMLWATPSIVLLWFVKGIREWIKERIKKAFSLGDIERREDSITRVEFESRTTELKQELRDHRVEAMAGHERLRETLDGLAVKIQEDGQRNRAEAREDTRDLRLYVEGISKDLFKKMDDFLAILAAAQRGKP